MNRQDKGSVRTALDLERKYNLAGMAKAVRMQEEGIHKTQTTLENFINNTLKGAQFMQSQTDGEVTTWFAHGEPNLDNEPAAYWTTDEQKEAHAGDLYYDRDTGNAYIFEFVDDAYKWSIVEDGTTIESLAIANSEYDTADNKRRVFTAQPYPPYENGDLWFDGTDIYICQISKGAMNVETGEAEVYEERDFIIATKYTDDTLAIQNGDTLQVLQGQVTEILTASDQFKAEVYSLDDKTRAELELIKNSLSTLIVGANNESLMTQTEDGWSFSIAGLISSLEQVTENVENLDGVTSETKDNLDEVTKALEEVQKVVAYMKFSQDENGDPCLELGTDANGFKSVHTNTGIKFMQDDTVLAYIDNTSLNIERATIHEELQIGGFVIGERANGNVGFVWKGDE